jgi:DNA topoisomerase-1
MSTKPDITALATPEALRAAEEAQLCWVSDMVPGIRRTGEHPDRVYLDPDGHPVEDEEVLARIRSLAIPPAWTDVWICVMADGHLQATGRDAKGRKQYRYHPRWRSVRDDTKFHRIVEFGAALPTIRRRIEAHLALRGLPREKVIATVVRLLETTFIRVGNDEYAAHNASYGLTTLHDEHVAIHGSRIRFDFRGKSGVVHGKELRDARLAKIVKRCQDLPGQSLFQFQTDDGTPHTIGSGDVNAWLREASGQPFTSKDFRTWAGTLLAFLALRAIERPTSEAARKRAVSAAMDRVSERLGNTRAVCRKSYVHPAVVEAFVQGELAELGPVAEEQLDATLPELRREEVALLRFLRAREAEKPAELEELLQRSRREARRKRSSSTGPRRERRARA